MTIILVVVFLSVQQLYCGERNALLSKEHQTGLKPVCSPQCGATTTLNMVSQNCNRAYLCSQLVSQLKFKKNIKGVIETVNRAVSWSSFDLPNLLCFLLHIGDLDHFFKPDWSLSGLKNRLYNQHYQVSLLQCVSLL